MVGDFSTRHTVRSTAELLPKSGLSMIVRGTSFHLMPTSPCVVPASPVSSYACHCTRTLLISESAAAVRSVVTHTGTMTVSS